MYAVLVTMQSRVNWQNRLANGWKDENAETKIAKDVEIWIFNILHDSNIISSISL